MTSRLTRFVLLLIAVLPLAALAAKPVAPPKGPAPVIDVDYVVIDGGQPYAAVKGKIEVAEVFSYACDHCAHFEAVLAPWKARLPADVVFAPVAAPMGERWMPYARAFFAAQALGLADKTHEGMFRALHVDGSLPLSGATAEEIASYYAGYGVSAPRFIAAMASPAVEAKLTQAREFMLRSGVEGTPTLIVNGKYRVIGRPADRLRIVDHLIARERAAKRR